MKIRLDECISRRVAAAVIAITANREGFEVSHVLDVHDKGIDDVDWITRFSDEGGTAIISGDNNILKNWPNLIAYKESGLIGFFPPPKFSGLTGYAKAALLIRWWPVIVEKIKLSSLGDTWRVPMYWTPNINSLKQLEDPRFGKDGKIIPLTGRQIHKGRTQTER